LSVTIGDVAPDLYAIGREPRARVKKGAERKWDWLSSSDQKIGAQGGAGEIVFIRLLSERRCAIVSVNCIGRLVW
jgi:hypothetical protein